MRSRMFCAGLLAMALTIGGCEKSSHDDTVSTDLSGAWILDVATQDSFVAFKGTALQLTSQSNNPTFLAAWMNPAPNGYVNIDTNTMTVTMALNNPPAILQLSGTLVTTDLIQGNGTVDGYGGLRVAIWEARRR